MPTVLVAADADRVQDLIFRSSRLREVTGASFALEEFWREAAGLAEEHWHGRPYVAAGGSIRVVFGHERAVEDAREFRRALEDLYAIQTGGTLTTVLLQEGNGPEGETALLAGAPQALGRAKLAGRHPTVSPHFPYLQPCDSCGRDLAATIHAGADPEARLCRICAERSKGRDAYKAKFLKRIQGGGRTLTDLPEDANAVGEYDGRGRVAYLLADGNGFGVMFGDALKRGTKVYQDLSRTVGEAGSRGIEAATAALVHALPEPRGDRSPVLPLITGGDDVFALIPAQWAFWFARKFADAFEEHVKSAKFFREAPASDKPHPAPTVSCALVFCKATFPYRFAHDAGEDALDEAKRRSRGAARQSVVRAIEVRDMAERDSPGPAHELGVFTLGGDGPGSVHGLMKARAVMDRLPRKRLHQIEELYAADRIEAGKWKPVRERLLARIGGDLETAARGALEGLDTWSEPALATAADGAGAAPAAGDPADGEAARTLDTSATVDLLHLWDYLLDLDPPPQEPQK